MENSVVLHCDANKFYASVELLHRPALRGIPMAVGGDEEARHGIILSMSPEAKKFGIQVGNSIRDAKTLCPQLITVPPNYDMYLKFSHAAREIFGRYTDRVEPFGLDEAWLDVSGSTNLFGSGETIAREIRETVKRELGITVSIGVSWNKIFSKLGSDMKKPDATTVITRDNYKERVWPLPVSDLLYVGHATERKLRFLGINTIGELAVRDPDRLRGRLGIFADMIIAFANGRDQSAVKIFTGGEDVVKSVGNSSTCVRDLVNDGDVLMMFYVLGESVCARMREGGYEATTAAIWIRDKNLGGFERQIKLPRPTNLVRELVPAAMELFRKNYDWRTPIRSIGIRGADVVPAGTAAQLSLGMDEARRDRIAKLERTVGEIRDRYGYFSVQRGIQMVDRRLTGLDAKKDNIIHPVAYDVQSMGLGA